jgi:hypothetical protein
VIDRQHITPWAALIGPKGDLCPGDVCPEPATIGTRQRHLGRRAKAFVVAASGGGQGGRQAFAVDRREVPT